MYATGYVEVYDLLMRERGKDHAGQSAEVARLVRERSPRATSLLDVACGTGLHLRHFDALFDRVMGVDLSEDMLRVARARIPRLRTRCADMRQLRLDAAFDAVTCLFAIPHLESAEELEATVDRLGRHLTPGGVLVVEPWYDPDGFSPGYVATDLIPHDDGVLFRVSHSTRHPARRDRIRMVVHVVEADGDSGIRPSTRTVDLTLFRREQYEQAFSRADLVADYLGPERFAGGLFDRGLWLACRD